MIGRKVALYRLLTAKGRTEKHDRCQLHGKGNKGTASTVTERMVIHRLDETHEQINVTAEMRRLVVYSAHFGKAVGKPCFVAFCGRL